MHAKTLPSFLPRSGHTSAAASGFAREMVNGRFLCTDTSAYQDAIVYGLVAALGPVNRDLGQRTWTPSLVSTSWVMSTSQAVEMRA